MEAGFLPLFVCFSAQYFNNRVNRRNIESPNLTQKRSTMSPGNPFILGSDVKDQGHESINRWVCVLLRVLASSYHYYCGV